MRKQQRGVAMIETMMVMLPLTIFFYLLYDVMLYWQDRNIDCSEAMATKIVNFNNSYPEIHIKGRIMKHDDSKLPFADGALDDAKNGIDPTNDPRTQGSLIVVTAQRMHVLPAEEKIKGGYEPQYSYEITGTDATKNYNGHKKLYYKLAMKFPDTAIRKLMFVRGTNSWLYFPYLRGQEHSEWNKWTKNYFDSQLHRKDINDMRKKIQLGS